LHKKYTGVSNKLIIDNLKRLNQVFNNIIVRVPFVPGYNDENNVQKDIYKLLSNLKNIQRVEIMPYHRLGKSKYEGLGRDYRLKELKAVNKKEIDYLKNFGLECGIKVYIDAQ
jgi:pyruvate formate lyase activating enzyme